MKETDLSRRKFLGRSGTAALVLPLAAAIPAAIEATSPKAVRAATAEDDRQLIPNRVLTSRSIGSTTVTVSGLPTDGTSDASIAIQNAIDSLPTGGGTVRIPWQTIPGKNMCVYMLDTTRDTDGNTYYAIWMRSNVRIECEPGVKLQAMTVTQDPVVTDNAHMIQCRNVNNVEIVNCWLVGERYTHVYSGLDGTNSDQYCHGIALAGVTGVTIRATQVSNCTADGINISATSTNPSSDVVLADVLSTGNRTRALGISSGNSISIYDSKFANTGGLNDMDGIHIEPHATSQTQVSNVTIENCVITGNAGNGIHLNANGANISNVEVKNCLVSYNYWYGFYSQMSGAGAVDTGSFYGNAFYQNGNCGMAFTGTTSNYIVGSGVEGNGNAFGDNQNIYNAIKYPNQTETSTYGYVSGTDMTVSAASLSAGTVIHWNRYYTNP